MASHGWSARRLGWVGYALAMLTLAPASVPAADPTTQRTSTGIQTRTTVTTKPDAKAAQPPAADAKGAEALRLQRLAAVKTWGAQLGGVVLDTLAAAPHDLLVIDATAGLALDRPFRKEEIDRLKKKPDGGRRLVLGYLAIGEAQLGRADYYDEAYEKEDAPDWLLSENARGRGNRIVKICHEGWQRTIIGDDDGRSLYNSVEAAPLHRLLELGFDGVVLDRVDAYAEVGKECPEARADMIRFVARIAASARKRDSGFLVLAQNAEELLADQAYLAVLDGIVREDLYFAADRTQSPSPPKALSEAVANLKRAKSAGRSVLVVDYVRDKAKMEEARKKAQTEGFVPYFAPRDLGALGGAG